MIFWTQKEPFSRPPNQEVQDALDKIKEEALYGAPITIRQFYTLIGLPIENSAEWACTNPEFYGEFFVNPDDWGWDEKGFRRLYEYITVKKRL